MEVKNAVPLHRVYYCVTESIFTTGPFTQYIMCIFQQKIINHTKRQKKKHHSLKILDKHQNTIKYDKNVGIIRRRIFKTMINVLKVLIKM